MKTIHRTNKAMLRVLGLDQLSNITSVDIALRPLQLPAVTVHMHAPDSLQDERQEFCLIAPLQAAPKPAFDLDAMCAAAQQRINAHIDHCARQHLAEMMFKAMARIVGSEMVRILKEKDARP